MPVKVQLAIATRKPAPGAETVVEVRVLGVPVTVPVKPCAVSAPVGFAASARSFGLIVPFLMWPDLTALLPMSRLPTQPLHLRSVAVWADAVWCAVRPKRPKATEPAKTIVAIVRNTERKTFSLSKNEQKQPAEGHGFKVWYLGSGCKRPTLWRNVTQALCR